MSGLSGIFGWFENKWIRQPLILGPSSPLREIITNANASAGDNYLYGAIVPTDEIWVVLSVTHTNLNTTNLSVSMGMWDDSTVYTIADTLSAVVGKWYGSSIYMVLFPGNKMYARFSGCTLNDYISFRYTGFKLCTGET